MGKEFYTCEYCFKKYRPTRRRVQKFCCKKCKDNAYNAKNPKPKPSLFEEENTSTSKTKIEAVSVAGVGNAALGTLAADGVKSFFISKENKPATKADIKNLTNKIIKRYHLVKNIPKRSDGALPYFDMETNGLIYSLWPL